MKKKIVSTMLCAAMITTMLAGCGGSDDGGAAVSWHVKNYSLAHENVFL